MFKESLKFQATEKEANKQQATERQERLRVGLKRAAVLL